MSDLRPPGPWALSDARTSFFTTAGGLAGVAVAWWGASGTGKLDRQTSWMVVGVAAVIVPGVGNAFWLLAGRRAVGLRRRDVLDALEVFTATSDTATDRTGRQMHVSGIAMVVVTGSSRYHTPTCLLVQGKATEAVDTAHTRGLTSCEMCAV